MPNQHPPSEDASAEGAGFPLELPGPVAEPRRLSVSGWLSVAGFSVSCLLAYHAAYGSPTLNRLDHLELRQQQNERDRSDILRELQRIEDRQGTQSAALNRLERKLGTRQ